MLKSIAEMTEEYLANGGKIKYIGKKPKRDDYQGLDIITIYAHHETIKVL